VYSNKEYRNVPTRGNNSAKNKKNNSSNSRKSITLIKLNAEKREGTFSP